MVGATISGPMPSPGRLTMRVLMGLAMLVAVVVAGPARAQGLDQTCALALTAFDPAVINVAYPDDSAKYYAGTASLLPGTRVRFSGRFPHARYMSFNVYDAALRPIDGLTDVRIVPDPGSSNPFVEGADRTTEQRSYTVTIEVGSPPERRAPNTLYAPAGVGLTFLYRIYIPDRGRDDYGGVGLPSAFIEPAGGAPGANGGDASPCADVRKPTVDGINETLAAQATPVDGQPTGGGKNPPAWRKFVNVLSSVSINATGSPTVGPLDLDAVGGSGGFLSNKDNAYVSAGINRGFSRVLVTQFRAPSTPDTRPGTARMPGGQLRYWSLCENDPPSQRFIACLNDDRSVLRDGLATFVVSPPDDRPANATADCGVNWLPWGPSPRGVLILRHMLPAPGFGASVQKAVVDREAATMGDVLPVSRYVTKAGFEALGCRAAAAQAVPASTRECLSRRQVAITLPRALRRARTARVRIGAGRVRTVRVRGRKVVVDLRGLRRGSQRVRVEVRSARGRTVLKRAYRTCTRRT